MTPNVPDSPHQRFQPTRIVFGTCHKNISLNTGDTIHSVLMIISCDEMEKSLPTCMSNTFQLPYHRGAAEQILVEVPSRNTESGDRDRERMVQATMAGRPHYETRCLRL